MAGSLPFLLHSRQLMKKLREAGAISEETAKTVEELGLGKKEIREIKRISHYTITKSIRETKDGRYYVAK